MVTKAEKEVMQQVKDKVEDTLSDVRKAFRKDRDDSPDSAYKAMQALAQEYETVDMKIYRKQPDSNKYDHFTERKEMPVEEAASIDWESVCREEGGAGQYRVESWFAPKEPGKPPKKLRIGAFSIGGAASYPVAKSEANKGGWFGDMFGMAGGLPTQNWNPNKGSEAAMREAMRGMAKASETQNNNMMNLVGMMMMKEFMGKGDSGSNGKSESSQIEALRQEMQRDRERHAQEMQRERERQQTEERMRRMEEAQREADRRSQDQFRQVLDRIDNRGKDKDLTLELMKLDKIKGDKSEDSLLKFMMMAREDNNAAQQRLDSMMMRLYEKPDGVDQTSKVMGMMMENSVSQLNLITQIAQSGLLGGNSESPWLDFARESLGGAMETIQEHYKAKQAQAIAGLPQGEEGEEDDGTPLQMQAPDAEVVGRLEGEAAEGTEEAPDGEQPQYTEQDILNDPELVKKLQLTQEELESMERDHATKQIFKALAQGDVRQATARIYGQANSGKKIHQKWLEIPMIISNQVLSHYGLSEYMFALPQDIVGFVQHVNGGGDPNEWSEEHKPIKTKVSKEGGAPVKSAPRPDYGVDYKEPEQGEKVDPSQTPPGVDPALVKAQREIRRNKALLARIEETEENINRLRQGKLPQALAEKLREDNYLPPAGQEQAFLEEAKVAKKELREILGLPDPEAQAPEKEDSNE